MKTQFAAQVSSCDSALSFDTASINSPSTSEAMLLNHEYADPVELQNSIRVELDKIDRQKKQNLIYEPTMTIKQNNIKEEKSPKCRFRNWCVVFVFLIASCALALSLLTTLGIIATKGNVETKVPLTSKYTGNNRVDTTDDAKIIKELQKNITVLNKQVPWLMQQLADLQSKLKNQTVVKGPQGERGPPGPRGGGDLSKCQYKTEGSQVSYHQDEPEMKTKATTMWITSDKNFTVVGATCTSLGGSEYGLFTKVRRGRRYYQCKCAGKSKTDAFKAPDMECRMHYWECPTIS